jgi:Icc-related predicted phosphoesterase
MRVAALYDIHGNLPALEAVLEAVRQADVDLVVVGGDVFPGPMPRETLTLLLSLDIPVRFIQGNGDREVLARMAGAETDWYRTPRNSGVSQCAGRRSNWTPSMREL